MRDSSINYAVEAVIYHAVNGNVFTSQRSQDGSWSSTWSAMKNMFSLLFSIYFAIGYLNLDSILKKQILYLGEKCVHVI